MKNLRQRMPWTRLNVELALCIIAQLFIVFLSFSLQFSVFSFEFSLLLPFKKFHTIIHLRGHKILVRISKKNISQNQKSHTLGLGPGHELGLGLGLGPGLGQCNCSTERKTWLLYVSQFVDRNSRNSAWKFRAKFCFPLIKFTAVRCIYYRYIYFRYI